MRRKQTAETNWAEVERRHRQQLEEFRRDWSWDRVFRSWRARFEDFAVDPSSLFVEVSVHDPAHPRDRQADLSWWPRDGIRDQQERIQQHLLQWPGTQGPIHPDVQYQRKGELDTLGLLHEAKEDAEKVAAILIAASLFARLRSSRRQFPRDHWPPFDCVEVLEVMAYERWQGKDYRVAWADTCTLVLPFISADYHYTLTDLGSLVRYIAEEHAAVFSQYRPIVINFSADCDPFVEKKFREQKRLEAEKQREWQTRARQEQATRELQRTERLKAHPRYEEWDTLSWQELQRLVWSMPTTRIAEQFGVSDSAIGKRCRAAGIRKPPPGFWNRVDAGKIPHPNGIPPSA